MTQVLATFRRQEATDWGNAWVAMARPRSRIDGPIKTFVLGFKDSPPYLHDGRLLTLDDTVEFFNLILETKLTEQEKQDLVTFMYTL